MNVQSPVASVKFGNQPVPNAAARLQEISGKNPVVQTMFDLIDIPSATPQNNPKFDTEIDQNLTRIRDVVIDKFKALGVTDIQFDAANPRGSLIIRLPGTPGYENLRPLMLTAHMDIVAGDPEHPNKAVQRSLTEVGGKEWIATDGSTTLGSDDKGGIAMILDTVARLQGKHPGQLTPLPHAPLEILFSPDEESSCASLKNLDTSQFKAKQVIVVDEFDPFKVTTGLASAVMAEIKLENLKGGHSGADITKPDRFNGILVLSELAQKLHSGVVPDPKTRLINWLKRPFWKLTGQKNKLAQSYNYVPTISKNIGLINAGSAPNAIPENGSMMVMLRSGSKAAQDQELARIRNVVAKTERKYQKYQPAFKIGLNIQEEYPAWQGDPKSPIPNWARQAAQAMNGPKVEVGPIHAAAQASILANKTNADGERFDAALIGPKIEEAHTVRERIDWQSLVDSTRWLGEIIKTYTEQKAKSERANAL